MAQQPLIKITCAALGRYYESLGKKYNNQFSEYCEENGYEDLLDEMKQGHTECGLCEFDEHFPFKDEPADNNEKNQFIFSIIEKCINFPQITFKTNVPELKKEYFSWKPKHLEGVCKKYSEQCPEFVDTDFEHDEGLLTILGIGMKYGFDYMLHLMDGYNRWRINNLHNKEIKDKSPATWSMNNAHFKQLRSLDEHYPQIAIGAIQTFNSRICTSLQFDPMNKIDDSLERICCHIRNAAIFVWNLLNAKHKISKFDDKGLCPFQYDFCIATGKPLVDETLDTEDDEEKEEYVDFVGNIQEKLKQNTLRHSHAKYHEADDQKETRVLSVLYNKFLCDNKLGDNKDAFNYLHKKRLITLVDRRVSKLSRDDLRNKDDIYMYEAPKNCRFIPTEAVPEWYINSSATCLVPPDLGAKHHFKGGLLTLSFHVKQENEIKCYLFWNGQMIRFMPSDIRTLLPNIVNMERDDNKNFIKNNTEIEDLIKEIQRAFFDEGFMTFRHQE